jgi:hypothetical protein
MVHVSSPFALIIFGRRTMSVTAMLRQQCRNRESATPPTPLVTGSGNLGALTTYFDGLV